MKAVQLGLLPVFQFLQGWIGRLNCRDLGQQESQDGKLGLIDEAEARRSMSSTRSTRRSQDYCGPKSGPHEQAWMEGMIC